MTTLLVALAGGVGAALRFVVDGALARRRHRTLPVGTLVINVTGSFLLGLLTALTMHHVGLDEWQTILGTGVLGGYTTFSTASVEAVTLALADGPRATVSATAHASAMLVLSMAAAGIGLWLG